MGSGEYQSSRCLRVAREPLSDDAVGQIARQAIAVAGLRGAPDPCELAEGLGYCVVPCRWLPNAATGVVTGKTIFYEPGPDPEETALRVAAIVATLVLEAWGYGAENTDRLVLALTA